MKKLITLFALALSVPFANAATLTNTSNTRIGFFEVEDYESQPAKIAAHIAAGLAIHADTVRMIFSVKGSYSVVPNVTNLVNTIQAYHQAGFHVTVTISGPLCSVGNCALMPSSPADFSTYMDNFLTAMGDTLPDSLEIWNEWDDGYGHLVNNKNVPYKAVEYLQLILQPAATQIKAHNLENQIELLTGATVEGSGNADLKDLVAAINTYGLDIEPAAYGYHPYATTWSGLESAISTAESIIPANKELSLTELGCDPSWETCSNMDQLLNDTFNPTTGITTHRVLEFDFYLMSLKWESLPTSNPVHNYSEIVILNDDSTNSHGPIYSIFQKYASQYVGAGPAQSIAITVSGTPVPVQSLETTSDGKSYCLTAEGTTAGSVVDLAPCTGAVNQSFQFNNGQGLTVFGSENPTQWLCVVVTSTGALQTAACDATPDQAWMQHPSTDPSFPNELFFVSSGKVLDIPARKITLGGKTTMEIYASNGGVNQKWSGLPSNVPAPVASKLLQTQGSNVALCANLDHGSKAVGTDLILYTCSSTAKNELFSFSGTAAPIFAYGGNTLCLGTKGGSTADGAAIVLASCSGSPDQTWTLSVSGVLTNGSGKCMDITNRAFTNGTQIELFTCNGGSNQQWQQK